MHSRKRMSVRKRKADSDRKNQMSTTNCIMWFNAPLTIFDEMRQKLMPAELP